jgi:hypothetical protein
MGGVPINITAWGLPPADPDAAVAAIVARGGQLKRCSPSAPERVRLNRETLEATPPELSTLVFISR